MDRKVNKSGEKYPVFDNKSSTPSDYTNKKNKKKKKKKKKTKAQKVFTAISIVCFLGALVSGGLLAKELMAGNEQTEMVAKVKDDVSSKDNLKDDGSKPNIKGYLTEDEKKKLAAKKNGDYVIEYVNGIDKNLLRKINFNKLKNINSDCEKWIYLPGTGIDSYVMRERKVSQYYYLWRDIYHRRNQYGSLFSPKIPEGHNDAHDLMFGHRTYGAWGDVVFAKLPEHTGSNKAIRKHPYFYIYYPDHAERWRIWAPVDASSGHPVYEIPYTLGSDDYEKLLNKIQRGARLTNGEGPDKYTKTTVLSTCNSAVNTGVRFFTVLVPEVKYTYGQASMEKFKE